MKDPENTFCLVEGRQQDRQIAVLPAGKLVPEIADHRFLGALLLRWALVITGKNTILTGCGANPGSSQGSQPSLGCLQELSAAQSQEL